MWRLCVDGRPHRPVHQGGSCLEVLDRYPAGVPVRDSKVPHGPALVFGPAARSPFVSALKAGFASA
ncbi:DUF397 domain-containing protein [Streptomyces adustus]|uniref:DUF397 domain-containing protein n=1 Tax=Streptomyces adustus TaxID=1609272 RepID=UPI0035E00024